jgi:hypothetical protein
MIILRSAEANRIEYGANPHAEAWARAHGRDNGGGSERHADRIARMQARARMVERQASSYVENFDFETGRDVVRSSTSLPGADIFRGGDVGPPFLAEGRGGSELPRAPPCSEQVPDGGSFIPAVGHADRSAVDEKRVAIHEASHCLSGIVLFGAQSLGGATIVPSDTFSGKVWGPTNAEETGDVPRDLCEAMRALMPVDGETIVDAGEIHAHVFGRCIDLLSGSEGERLLCADGPPWHAESDLAQARNLASIICSSNVAIELYLDFCSAEAANLVAKHNVSIRAVAAALIEHRTLTGDQIVSFVAESVAREAMAAERQRRRDWRERTESACGFLVRR